MDFSSSELKVINLCCFKVLCLWLSVAIAIKNRTQNHETSSNMTTVDSGCFVKSTKLFFLQCFLNASETEGILHYLHSSVLWYQGQLLILQFSRSVMSDSLQPHRLQHARLPCPSPTSRACSNSSIKSVMPSNHLILCRPLLLLPSIFPSIRVFSNESVLRKYWSFSFSISPSDEYPGLISFRIDWFDLLTVQGTLESSPIPQFKSINSSVLSFLFF